MGLTILRFSPMNAFSKLDLPTLGRPIIATLISSLSLTTSSGAGRCLTNSSNNSPVPLPWIPDIGIGSPKPRFQNSAASDRPNLEPSHLFTASSTGIFCRRNQPPSCSSASVIPAIPSTTKITAADSRMAISACSRIIGKNSVSSSNTNPPVSTTWNSCAPQKHSR